MLATPLLNVGHALPRTPLLLTDPHPDTLPLAGYHQPFRTGSTPSGVGYPSHSHVHCVGHLEDCALCQSEADARIASSHRFEIRLQFGLCAGGGLEPFPADDDEDNDEDNDEDGAEGAAFVRADQKPDASRAETWMPGSGCYQIATPREWEGAAVENWRADLVNGVPTRFVPLLVCVHVMAVGERLCTACGAEASRGACVGCMGIAQWCPVRYCSLACRAAAAARHQPACRATRSHMKRTAVNWHDSPGRSWVVGAGGLGKFVETGPAGPPLCKFEEDWCHTHAHALVDEAWVRVEGEETPTLGVELPRGSEAYNAFLSLRYDRRKFDAWMRRIHPNRLAYYTHEGQRVSVRATTVATIRSLMRAEEVSTGLKIRWLLTHLFASDMKAPQFEAEDGPNGGEVKVINGQTTAFIRPAPQPQAALVGWEESVYCKHGHGHKTPPLGIDAECKCTFSLPPATPQALRELADVISSVVYAGKGLDWSEPPLEAAEGEEDVPYTSMVGEALAELESSWETLIRRATGLYCGDERRPAVDWWEPRGEAYARVRNQRWRTALRGSGAKSKGGGYFLFDCTGILLNFKRLEAMPGDGSLYFDQHGLAHVHVEETTQTSDPPDEAAADPPDEAPARNPADAVAAHLSDAATDQELATAAAAHTARSDSSAAVELEAASTLDATGAVALRPGQRVRIHGLQQRADLNGSTGTVAGALHAESGRVRVDLGSEFIRVRVSNLTLL